MKRRFPEFGSRRYFSQNFPAILRNSCAGSFTPQRKKTAHAPSVPRRGMMRPRFLASPAFRKARKGARGMPGTSRSPRPMCEKIKAHGDLPRVPEAIPTSRTRWHANKQRGLRYLLTSLLCANPGGVTRPSFWERPFYPPLADRSPERSCLGHGKLQTRRSCGAWSRRRTAMASAAMQRLRTSAKLPLPIRT